MSLIHEPPGVFVWFDAWLKLHHLLYPDPRWVDPESDQGMEFYQGWMDSFVRNRVTDEEAKEASKRLQSRAPRWGHHLEAILGQVREIKNSYQVDARKPDPELQKLREQSKGCGECSGSGWSKRPIRLETFPSVPMWASSLSCASQLKQAGFRRSECLDAKTRRERDLATVQSRWHRLAAVG